jgi:hypothetical protein
VNPPRWTFEHVVAVVELVCAVIAVVWLSAPGVAGSALLFGLGMAIAAVLVTSSVRLTDRADTARVPTRVRLTVDGPSGCSPTTAPAST